MRSERKSVKDKDVSSDHAQEKARKQDQAETGLLVDGSLGPETRPLRAAATRDNTIHNGALADDDRAASTECLYHYSDEESMDEERLRGNPTTQARNDEADAMETSSARVRADDIERSVDIDSTDSIQEQLEQAATQRRFWSNQYETLLALNLAQNKPPTASANRHRSGPAHKIQRKNTECSTCHQFEELSKDQEMVCAALISKYESLFTLHEELTAHCNQLLMQNSRSQPLNPSEENAKATQQFRKLNAAVRNWCMMLEDFQSNEPRRFHQFPLAKSPDTFVVHKWDLWLSMACTWEWLVKFVFGHEQQEQRPPIVDLWTDDNTAKSLKNLEHQIKASQGRDALLEWRSYTVRSLVKPKDNYDKDRVEELASNIVLWFLDILGHAETDSPAVEKLRQALKAQIIIPAVELQFLLRQCRTLILIDTPVIIEDAIRKHITVENGSMPALEVIVEPELKRIEYSSADGEGNHETILAAAFPYPIVAAKEVDEVEENQESNSPTKTDSPDSPDSPAKDRSNPAPPSPSTRTYSSQQTPVYRKVTEPQGANKPKPKPKGKRSIWRG